MNENALKITPEFLLEMALRRRWIILPPLFIALVIGICLAIVLPRIYEARTLILIEPQRVPQNYVQPIVSTEAGDRISTLSQQIMSRTNLEKIITDFKLFSDPKQVGLYMEDKIKSLSQSINIEVTRDSRGVDAFSISFRGHDPRKVMQVTNGLANSFIDENLKARESQALGTSDFLDAELETMRQKLEKLEEKIKEYRRTYMGELPEQLDTNLRILDRLQEDLNDRQQSIREARAQLAELNTQAATKPQQVVVIGNNQRANDDSTDLEELKSQLESLQSRYTAKHPDILRLKKLISEMTAKQKSLSAENIPQAENNVVAANLPPELRRQIYDTRREIQVAESEISDLRAQISEYKHRIENTPKREQELLSLRRDYQIIQGKYDSLSDRKIEADMAVSMERKQKGEQFRVVDPARLPQKPVAPDLRKLFLIVVAAGLLSGGGVAFLMEYLNTAFRKPDELEAAYDIPVLTAIPTIYKPRQLFLHKVNNLSSIVFSALTLVCFAFFVIICIKGDAILDLV